MGWGLAHRRRQLPTHRLAEGRENPHAPKRQEHEAALEAQAGQRAAPDALPLSAADYGARQHPGRREADRHRDRRLRQHLRHRCRKGRGDLEEALRQHLDSACHCAARRRHPLPRRNHRHAGDRPHGHARQVHHLRRVLGRHAAPTQRGRWRRRGAAPEVHAAQRQALRAESLEQRDLHAHRAGLRRQSQHRLLLRPRHEQGRHLGSGGWRHVGPHRSRHQRQRHHVHRYRRRTLGSRKRHLRQRHHRREAESADQGARAGGLLRTLQRRVAGEARSRYAGDARRSSTTRARN